MNYNIQQLEEVIITGLLQTNPRLISALEDDDFSIANRCYIDAMRKLISEGYTVDIISIGQKLNKNQRSTLNEIIRNTSSLDIVIWSEDLVRERIKLLKEQRIKELLNS